MTPVTPEPEDWQRVVIGWIRDQPVGRFARWAETEQDIVPDLLSQWPPLLRRMARGYLGHRTVRRLQHAGPEAFAAIVEELIRPMDLVGQYAWAHRPWLTRQLMAARDAFLGE